ncbi:Hypothetical predicted protein, partial [Marmota monax]
WAPRHRPGHVAFTGTTVFYFPWCQGFTSVPSRGGCAVGMASRHGVCATSCVNLYRKVQAW